jgi:hypothetical protein
LWTGLVKDNWRDEDLLLQLLLELVLIARTHLLLFLTVLLFLWLLLQWLLTFCLIIIITLTKHSFILIFIPYQPLILILITLPLRLSIIFFSLLLKHQLLLSIRLVLTIGLNHFDSHVIDNFLLVHVCNMACAEIHPLH